MKKLGLSVIAAAVIAGGVYINQIRTGESSMLAQVPVDTVFFAAQVTPYPLRAQLEQFFSPVLSERELAQLKRELEETTAPSQRFLMTWFLHYAETADDADRFLNDYGLADDITGYSYFIGMIPVLKSSLAHPDRLFATLDRFEAQSGQRHEMRTLGERQARVYPLDLEGNGEVVELWVAHHQGELTLTLGAPFLAEQQIKQALGVTHPAKSLADSKEVAQIKQRNGFSSDNLGFISHRQLVTGLFSEDGNEFARQMTKLIDNPSEVASFRNPECLSEWSAIAGNWPRTSFENDYRLENGKLAIEGQMVVESYNGVIVDALAQMRGFLPDLGRGLEGPLLSIAMGINADTLQQSLTTVRDQWLEQEYQCQALGEIQDELKMMPPEALGLFAGFTDGVQGISLSVFDYVLNQRGQGAQMLESVDMLVSFTAKDPGKIIATGSTLLPPLAELNIKPGEKKQMDQIMGEPLPQIMTAEIAGEHLMIYVGTQSEAAAQRLAGQAPTANGLFSVVIDYRRAIEPVFSLLTVMSPEAAAELVPYAEMDARLALDLDVDSRGLVFGYRQVPTGQ
ncbi:hypothetical protein FCL40_12625 [Ferrimonas sediminicola]|uniref:DUF3352 domain-containing protein n=1 Tax=Ferrimonas sediminicola TaxID=2569538 RepID=A0A4U1BDA3_9GAMM|nr:hypothetical protein [Ferrimonas sediminicola]TKB48546.1 hypothetical protein FCL40_12625 [Ferrimonas sediminicola]